MLKMDLPWKIKYPQDLNPCVTEVHVFLLLILNNLRTDLPLDSDSWKPLENLKPLKIMKELKNKSMK
jgi:hypothetical protein